MNVVPERFAQGLERLLFDAADVRTRDRQQLRRFLLGQRRLARESVPQDQNGPLPFVQPIQDIVLRPLGVDLQIEVLGDGVVGVDHVEVGQRIAVAVDLDRTPLVLLAK